jgi:threonine aldolase
MLAEQGVLMLAESDRRVRAVTHLDVSDTQIDQAMTVIDKVLRRK